MVKNLKDIVKESKVAVYLSLIHHLQHEEKFNLKKFNDKFKIIKKELIQLTKEYAKDIYIVGLNKAFIEIQTDIEKEYMKNDPKFTKIKFIKFCEVKAVDIAKSLGLNVQKQKPLAKKAKKNDEWDSDDYDFIDNSNDSDDSDDSDDEWDSSDDDDVATGKRGRPDKKGTDEIKDESLQKFFEIRDMNKVDRNEDTACTYFKKLCSDSKEKFLNLMREVEESVKDEKSLYVKIVESAMMKEDKPHVIKRLNYMDSSNSEESLKYKTWLEKLLSVPFGINKGIDFSGKASPEQIYNFLNDMRDRMNTSVFGHDETKDKVCEVLAQEINNPSSKGCVLGIYGPPGNGKTTIIKEGVAKAMDRPFIFISLGGAQDGSILEGHSFTYIGSICGRIIDEVIKAKCMNPIFYFDELDKVSTTDKGREIINILMHLIDPSQNAHFQDKYFDGVSFDLSRATFMFSFNDISKIDPILLDRITGIEAPTITDLNKLPITKQYLLPSILAEVGIDQHNIVVDNNVVEYLVDSFTDEGGVRQLKQLLFDVVRKTNLAILTKQKIMDKHVTYPHVVTLDMINKYYFPKRLKFKSTMNDGVWKIGCVHSLYYREGASGGIGRIQMEEIPSEKKFDIHVTGNVKQIKRETMDVGKTLAWKYLPEDKKQEWLTKWEHQSTGVHVHCPEASQPKDGPSAGIVTTLCFYSLLTGRKVNPHFAVTGEVDFLGNAMEIGGLLSKCIGAKKAGIKHVLFPIGNLEDYNIIKRDHPEVFDDTFKGTPIKHFTEAIQYCLE
jgi:ATP-dependent Lon protease